MIIVQKSTYPVRMYVPLNGYTQQPQELAFSAISTADNTALELVITKSVIAEFGANTGAFIALYVTLPEDMALGEWEYTLAADGEAVSQGIMQVTEDGGEPAQYNANDEYKQYGE